MRQKTWKKATKNCITIAKFFLSVIKFANGANAFVSRGLWTIVYFLFFNFISLTFLWIVFQREGKQKGFILACFSSSV